MIKHHPKQQLLASFVKGELPASLSAAIAIHADMCSVCQEKIAEITEIQAAKFQEASLQPLIVDDGNNLNTNDFTTTNFNEMDLACMVDKITAEEQSPQPQDKVKTIKVVNNLYTLPRAIQNIEHGGFTQLGKLSRARLKLNEGDIHSSLLHIQPGGSVPEHSHKGYELTLLLSGEFKDEHGCYVPGDFIMLDAKHTHRPESVHGCLCFTVANDSLHFTQGINRLLNPIGCFIY